MPNRNYGLKKKILLIGTGGTIASAVTEDGLTPELTTEQLLTHIPAIFDHCQADCLQLLNLDSTNITPLHWLRMAQCIQTHYNDYDGFVLTHGTDTMAYTAAALSYLIQGSPKPIVFTGAQKPIGFVQQQSHSGNPGKEDPVQEFPGLFEYQLSLSGYFSRWRAAAVYPAGVRRSACVL